MKARIIISGGNPNGNISMSLEDYVVFIKEQSELLGIKEREKSTRTIVTNVDMKDCKTFDEAMEGINKAARRISQC